MNFYLPLILFCFSTSITPGPNNIMIMMSGAKFGLARSLPHYLGICIGFNLMVFLVGIGLGGIFDLVPILHIIIKYLGVIYMLYMAAGLIMSQGGINTNSGASNPFTFVKAALFQWVNPKAWMMAIGVISTYTVNNTEVIHQAVIISLIFFIVGLPCIGAWFIFGIKLSKYLHSARNMKIFNVTMGVLLILSIVLILFE